MTANLKRRGFFKALGAGVAATVAAPALPKATAERVVEKTVVVDHTQEVFQTFLDALDATGERNWADRGLPKK